MHTSSALFVAIFLASFSFTDALPPLSYGFSSPMQSYNEYTTTSYNSDQGASPVTTTVVHGINGQPPVTYTTTSPLPPLYNLRRGIHSQGGEGGSDDHPPVFMPDAHSVPNPVENSSEDPIFHSGEMMPMMQSDANDTTPNDVAL